MTADLTYLFDGTTNDLVEMDSVKRQDLLRSISEIGMVKAAAAELGLTMEMVSDAVANDPRLKADIAIAVGCYQASVLRRMSKLAFEGSEKAIVGGKNKDDIIGVDVIPNDKALDILSRMQFADDLAQVTRQQIKATIESGNKDELNMDLSQLDRADRREFEALIRKAQKTIEQVDKKNGE